MSFGEFKISNVNEVLEYFGNLPSRTDDEIKFILDDISRKITAEARRLAPVDSGNLRRSIDHAPAQKINENGVWQSVVGSKLDYSPFMEYGTGSNSDGPTGGSGALRVSPRSLVNWVARKLTIGPDQTAEQVAFAVAKSIERKGGLKPRRFLRNALGSQAPRIRDYFEYTLSRIVNRR